MLNCPFDSLCFESTKDLLKHMKKCWNASDKSIYFCNNNLFHFFKTKEESIEHSKTCKDHNIKEDHKFLLDKPFTINKQNVGVLIQLANNPEFKISKNNLFIKKEENIWPSSQKIKTEGFIESKEKKFNFNSSKRKKKKKKKKKKNKIKIESVPEKHNKQTISISENPNDQDSLSKSQGIEIDFLSVNECKSLAKK